MPSHPAAMIACAATALALLTGPANARERRAEVTPYLEVDQILFADLANDNDVLTYTTVAAGIDASVASRNADATISVRYERTITYDDRLTDVDTLSGLARATARVAPGVTIEGGALAARSRVDGRRAAPGSLLATPDNVTQIYSGYAGPSFAGSVGDVGVTAGYRIGYTRVESPDAFVPAGGGAPVDLFDDSTSQAAEAAVFMAPSVLGVGWNVSAGAEQEDGRLDQRLRSAHVRGDLTIPVTPTLAAVGGIGYETIEISERDVRRLPDGTPVVGRDGRFIIDRSSPRLLAYDQDGLIWDVGVLWRPSRRTSLEARVGERYGSTTYVGSFAWAPNEQTQLAVLAYDTVTGLGGFINDNLDRLPAQFSSYRNPLSGDLQGCAFGGAGTLCFGDLLQSASSSSFRARGVTASYATQAAGWDTGVALGYSRRTFFAAPFGARASINGLEDESYFMSWFAGRKLDALSSVQANAYATLYDPGAPGFGDVTSLGANASYARRLIRGLDATAAVGIDHSAQENVADDQTTASALLGLRYSF